MSKISYIFQIIQKFSNQTPDKIALKYKKEEITYRQLYERSNCIAMNLAAHLSPNTTVVLHLPNSPQLVYAYLGCFAAGLIAIPMSTKLKPPEIDYILEQTKPAYFISHHDNLAQLLEVNFNNKQFQKLFIVNGTLGFTAG